MHFRCINDPLCSLDDLSLCGESIQNCVVKFTYDACKHYEGGRDNSPLYVFQLYLKCKLLKIICIGYHKLATIYSYIKCQCIGRKLDLKC